MAVELVATLDAAALPVLSQGSLFTRRSSRRRTARRAQGAVQGRPASVQLLRATWCARARHAQRSSGALSLSLPLPPLAWRCFWLSRTWLDSACHLASVLTGRPRPDSRRDRRTTRVDQLQLGARLTLPASSFALKGECLAPCFPSCSRRQVHHARNKVDAGCRRRTPPPHLSAHPL